MTFPHQEPGLHPGAMVDHFKVVRRVGRGGMGEVYLARDTSLGRKVALKLVRPDAIGSEEAVQRFLFEARATATFAHPHIVTVYAAGNHDGAPYVALEYLEGQNLRERLALERLAPSEALRYAAAIADALREAHQKGILHRDLKPENVLIPSDGRLRVVDFGLAKQLHDMPSLPERVSITLAAGIALEDTQIVTAAGGLRGTPAYMAPEQWLEQAVTPAADIWSLGLVLHEMLTGRRPYEDLPMTALFVAVTSPDPVPVLRCSADASGEVDQLLQRCLSKDPKARPTAADVAEFLTDLLAPGRSRTSETHSPFRGLLPFTERHADLFFGREAEVALLVERMRQESILPIVGPSGAGKSSFVQAGVVPRLREQGRWLFLGLRPGASPFRTLAARLRSGESSARGQSTAGGWLASQGDDDIEDQAPPLSQALKHEAQQHDQLAQQLYDSPATLTLALLKLADQDKSRVLLFIDQLEELFTLVDDSEVRLRFIHAICAAADDPQGPIRVIFTVRDDFLGRLADGPGAREALTHVTVLRSPGAEELREIMIRPLRSMGYAYEDPALVEQMIDDVHGAAVGLPLLQFATRMLWERRDKQRRLLTRAAYEQIGGVAGALAAHADGIIEHLPPSQALLASQMLLRLVTVEGTRSVASEAQVLDGLGADAKAVLRTLVDARLVTVRRGHEEGQESELELAHESLVTGWASLARWVSESRNDMRFIKEVSQAADLWNRRGRRDGEVWQGEALHEALRKADRSKAQLPQLVNQFLAQSRERERRRVRNRRLWIAASFGAIASVAITAVIIAWAFALKNREIGLQQNQAETQRALERQRRADAEREGAAAAFARNQPLESRAKLRASLEIADSIVGRTLWSSLLAEPLAWEWSIGQPVYDVCFSPGGQHLAAAGEDKFIYVLDASTGKVLKILRGMDSPVYSLRYSPDGKTLASGHLDGVIRLWRTEGVASSRELKGHGANAWELAFSPDGKTLASAGWDGPVRVWDVDDARQIATLNGHQGPTAGVVFTPDGKQLLTTGTDSIIRLWDLAEKRELGQLRGHESEVRALAVSHNGEHVASAGWDRTVRLWDLGARKPLHVLRGHADQVDDVSFSPDGKVLLSAGSDGALRLWGVPDGRLLQVLQASGAKTYAATFSPDGRWIASASMDGSVRLFDAQTKAPSGSREPPGSAVLGLAFSPTAAVVATGHQDRAIRVRNIADGKLVSELLDHSAEVTALAYQPQGHWLASGGADRSVRLWDPETQQVRRVMVGHEASIKALAFTSDGTRIASCGWDKTVRLWNVETGAEVATLRAHTAGVTDVEVAYGLAVTGGWDGLLRVWDKSWTSSRALAGHSLGGIEVALGPGGKLVSGSWDRTVRLWDTTTGTNRILAEHKREIVDVALHPDGALAATASADGRVRLIALDSGSARDVPSVTSASPSRVGFSADGTHLGLATTDGTLRLWDTQSLRPTWFTTVMVETPARIHTHLGWHCLADSCPVLAPSAWKNAVEAFPRRASSAGHMLCLVSNLGELEMWDTKADQLVAHQAIAGVDDVLAVPGACLTLSGGRVRLHNAAGGNAVLRSEATSMSSNGDKIVVAAWRSIVTFDLNGVERDVHYADTGITATARADDALYVGFVDGSIERIELGDAAAGLRFESAVSSPVRHLLLGPRGVLIAGFESGLVGMWSLDSGKLLSRDWLHGPVSHLRVDGQRLIAASEIGGWMVRDLQVLRLPYCDLLRQLWRSVPVIWQEGDIVQQPAPASHPCTAP